MADRIILGERLNGDHDSQFRPGLEYVANLNDNTLAFSGVFA
jgi:hypothetical protein